MGILDVFRKKKAEEKSKPEQCYEESSESEWWDRQEGESAYTGNQHFFIMVEDVFTITGRGTVIVGRIESGCVSVGDMVQLTRTDGTTHMVKVIGLEMYRKIVDTAHKDDNVGILLRDVGRNEIGKGDILEKW